MMALVEAALPGCKAKAVPETMVSAQGSATASPPPPNPPPPGMQVDAPFEGEIRLAVYGPSAKAPASIVYEVKGDKIRSETASGGAGDAHLVSDLKQRKS